MSRLGIVAVLVLTAGLILSACGGSEPNLSSNPSPQEPEDMATESPEDASKEEPQLTEEYIDSSNDYSDLEIITLLPQDAIPAIDNPQFLSSDEADEEYAQLFVCPHFFIPSMFFVSYTNRIIPRWC